MFSPNVMAIVSCLCSFVFHLLIVGSSEIGRMDVVHMPECQLCSLQHLLPLFEFDHFVSTCRMAKLDGFQRGRYEWLVDPPTTEGNPKFESFFSTFGMSLSSPISLTVFIFLLQVTTQPAALIGNKGEKKIS